MYNRVKKKHRYRSMLFMKKYDKKNKHFNTTNWVKIILPKKIDLSGRYRNHLLNNIRQITNAIIRGETNILLDFGNTTHIIATGMIVLYLD